MEQAPLSPRLARLARGAAGGAGAAFEDLALALAATGISTYLAVTKLFLTPEDFVAAGSGEDPSLQGALKRLWVAADQEEGHYLEACARVRQVARKHKPLYRETHRGPIVGPTERCPGGAVKAPVRSWAAAAPRKRMRAGAPCLSAQEQDAHRLEKAVLRALALQHEVGPYSGRIASFVENGLPQQDQDKLLRNLAVHRATVATTIEQHLRSLTKLAAWAEARGKIAWTLSAPELAVWAEGTAGGAKSVPRQLLAGLRWASSMYLLPWPLQDPLITATEALSTREAAARRKQAPPYDQRVIDSLEDVFKEAATRAEKFIAGFLLVLAMGVLRFSDLNRSSRLTLGRDSLHGICWKSKKKIGEMPWAMLRRTHRSPDLGGEVLLIFKAVLPLTPVGGCAEAWETSGWLWPHMTLVSGVPQLTQPVRQGSYHNCINMQGWLHSRLGHDQRFTLHSPRFYLPTVAGQLQMSVEERNLLGHWDPHSKMPLRYDQARCAGELIAKNKITSALKQGFIPAGPFELPGLADARVGSGGTSLEVGAEGDGRLGAASSTQPTADSREMTQCLCNTASHILHKLDTAKGGRLFVITSGMQVLRISRRYGYMGQRPALTSSVPAAGLRDP